jgi:hypothetical protein
MPEISTIKNSLQTVVKKDRLLNAAFAGGKALVVSVSRTFYAFWLQTTGLLYVGFTGSGIFYLVREYRHGFPSRLHLWVASVTTLVCFCFTVQSFIRAKSTLKRK